MKKYLFLTTFLFGLIVSAQQKPIYSRINIGDPKPRVVDAAIKEYPFFFKGFSVVINDEATDELGNHMLIGRIKALVRDESKRDSFINKSLDFSVGFYDDHAIMISTDKNYKILKIRFTYPAQVISYNTKLKKFIIGANDYAYNSVEGRYTGKWQPMIVVVSLDQYGNAFAIKNDYPCFLKNYIIEDDKIHILAAVEESKYNEKLEIITVDLNKFHEDKEVYLPKILDPVSKINAKNQDYGRMDISAISTVDSTYYFSTSNFNSTKIINQNRVYQFDGKELTEQEESKYFLFRAACHNPDLVKVNDFYAISSNEYIFLNKNILGKEMQIAKTNAYFDIIKDKKTDLFNSIDNGKMVLLPNGTIVILSPNETKNWCYTVYNSEFEVLKKIDSNLSTNYYPGRLKAVSTNIECFFYETKEMNNNSILQIVTVN